MRRMLLVLLALGAAAAGLAALSAARAGAPVGGGETSERAALPRGAAPPAPARVDEAVPDPAQLPGDTRPPTPPRALRATAATRTAVALAWSPAEDDLAVAGYRIFLDGMAVDAVLEPSFTLRGLACGTRHVVAVEAYDRDGNTSRPQETEASTAPCPPDPVVVAAGDIGAGALHAARTGRLIDAIDPDAVLALGDNAYSHGTLAQYRRYYEPTWGRHKEKTYPVPGNHEYDDPAGGARGYFEYFGERAGEPRKGWYAWKLGAWQLLALNSNCRHAGGCAPGSPQHAWLKAQLKGSRGCTLAYWHHPRFASGKLTDDEAVAPFWELLHAAGAEIVLVAHDHNYQRYAPLGRDGEPDPERGIRQFVVGTGGKNLYRLRAPGPAAREAATDEVFGVLKLTLRDGGYDWEFVAEEGSAYRDRGSGRCR